MIGATLGAPRPNRAEVGSRMAGLVKRGLRAAERPTGDGARAGGVREEGYSDYVTLFVG